jgi:hypothetical protein
MCDLFEDLVDAFGPDEWFWIGVVIDIELDGCDEIGNAFKGTASNAFSCDVSKPALDEVQPRGTRWDEVQMEARVFFYPVSDAGMLMRGVIVDYEM